MTNDFNIIHTNNAENWLKKAMKTCLDDKDTHAHVPNAHTNWHCLIHPPTRSFHI